jgi:sugar phosphate isomerase/epimerase
MVMRLVPGGYKPEHGGETTFERVRRAVEDNLDEVRGALDGHDVYCMATGLHFDPRFGRGRLVSPDDATRVEALRRTAAAIDFADKLGAHFIIRPGLSVLQWRFIDQVAARIDEDALHEAQMAKDAIRAYELVYAAMGAG